MGNIVNSVKWSSIDRLAVQAIQFILSMVIARQLLPSDYGVVAMLSIFINIAQVFIDSGFSQALIQKQNRTQKDYSTVFYFNIVVGVALYGVFVLCAPWIADFYNAPLLKVIIAVVGINFVVNSFSTVQRALISINLEFKKQAKISLMSVLVSGSVALWMAYHNYGPWTLVLQFLINNICNTILLWVTSKWHPIMTFSMQSFNEMFAFGSKLLASNILHKIYCDLYNVIIGKVFAPSDLGYFNRAYTLSTTPSNIFTSTIARAVYPIECKMQDKPDELASKFLSILSITSVLVFPILLGISAVAQPMIKILLTDKWLPCVPYIQIMCFAYMFDPIMGISADLLSVKRRGDYVLITEILKKICAFSVLFATIFFGIKVMCIGLVLYAFCDMAIVFVYIHKLLPQITAKILFKTFFPILMSALIMWGGVFLFCESNLHAWFRLIVGILMGGVIYIAVGMLIMPQNIKLFFSLLKNGFK